MFGESFAKTGFPVADLTALTTLAEGITNEGSRLENKLLKGELIVRRSSGAPVNDGNVGLS